MLDTIMSYLPKDLMTYVSIAMAVISAASVFAAAIAKLTKTDKDDKVAALIQKIHDFLAKLGFHPPLAEKVVGKAVVRNGATVVYDHRSK